MLHDRDPGPLGRLPLWLTPLVYAALHFGMVAIGLQMQIARPSVAAFWPASGLALAALLLCRGATGRACSSRFASPISRRMCSCGRNCPVTGEISISAWLAPRKRCPACGW